MYILKENLLKWFTGCGLSSPTMVVSQREGQEYSSCSVHDARCLNSSNLVLESQGILREILVFSLH